MLRVANVSVGAYFGSYFIASMAVLFPVIFVAGIAIIAAQVRDVHHHVHNKSLGMCSRHVHNEYLGMCSRHVLSIWKACLMTQGKERQH